MNEYTYEEIREIREVRNTHASFFLESCMITKDPKVVCKLVAVTTSTWSFSCFDLFQEVTNL